MHVEAVHVFNIVDLHLSVVVCILIASCCFLFCLCNVKHVLEMVCQ